MKYSMIMFCEICGIPKGVTKHSVKMCLDHDVHHWYCGNCMQKNFFTDKLIEEVYEEETQ